MRTSFPFWQPYERSDSAFRVVPPALGLDAIRPNDSSEFPVSQQLVSWFLFWPTLTLIARQAVYFDGPARTPEFTQNGAAFDNGGSSHLFLFLNFAFLLAFVIAGHREVWTTLKRNLAIPAMLALAVCSTLWSLSPGITLQVSLKVCICSLFACYLSSRCTTERLMEFLIFMGVAASLLSYLFVLALPSYGIFQGYAGGGWQGICNHKNALGISMAFLLSPVFFTNAYSRGRRLIYATSLLLLIYKSESRGAWAYTIGMMLFVGWISLIRRIRGRELTLIVVTTTVAALAMTGFGIFFWESLAASVGKDPSMTGRTQIYIEVWRSILKHPILGYGFGGFWGSSPEAKRIGLAIGWPNIGYSENGLLELALQAGLIGVGVASLFIGRSFIKGLKLLRSPSYAPRVGWFLTILFLAALTNVDAGWFMTSDTLDWVLILVACIGLRKESASLNNSFIA